MRGREKVQSDKSTKSLDKILGVWYNTLYYTLPVREKTQKTLKGVILFMDENKNTEVGLADIVKVLVSKKVLIITIVLIALVAGAVLGVWSAPKPGYGTQIQFSITSRSLDTTFLHQLSTENFLEQLLLDENGLPAPADPDNPGEAYVKAAAAKQAYDEILQRRRQIDKEMVAVSLRLSDAQLTMDAAGTEFSHAVEVFTAFVAAPNVPSDHYTEDVARLQADLDAKSAAYNAARQNYDTIRRESDELSNQKSRLSYEIMELEETKNTTAAALLNEWRSTDEVQAQVKLLKKGVTFEYPFESTDKVTNCLLYINISLNDEKLAEQVVDRLIEYMPEFVNDTNGIHVGEECVLVSTFHNLERVNTMRWGINGALFGGIAAVAALVVICVVALCSELLRKTMAPVEKKEEVSKEADTAD